MKFLYTTVQILFSPCILFLLLLSTKREENLKRLGFGLNLRPKQIGRKSFWLHAVTISEITASKPLLEGLRRLYPDAEFFYSTLIEQDQQVAQQLLDKQIDYYIPFPLAHRFAVSRFIRLIEPDLFLSINSTVPLTILERLRSKEIPAIAANLQITSQQNKQYKRFAFIYRQLFALFENLCVQTDNDRQKLLELGVESSKIHTLGNLKFDFTTGNTGKQPNGIAFTLPDHNQLLIASSTHEGEEEIILTCYKNLRNTFPGLYLILAPYATERGPALHHLANDMGLLANRRSQINAGGKDLLILDTLGELNTLYGMATVAYIGGSMVDAGGHNPIEAASAGIPLLFGPHMKNYFDISGELMHSGGAIMVRDQRELLSNLEALLANPEWLQKKGAAAKSYTLNKQGVVPNHLRIIKKML